MTTFTMIEPEARLVHLVPGEWFEETTELGLFAGFKKTGPALCGQATTDFDILHPVGDRLRYQGIIGEVRQCEGCREADKRDPAHE